VHVPEIDVAPFVTGAGDQRAAAAAIDAACRETGFFAIVGHGVDDTLRRRLDTLAREFFALDDREKAEIAMAHGGRAWRGWFPVGGELTSGVPDQKEGIYFGAELAGDDPRVRAGLPLHGPNLFPRRPAELRATVLEYLDAMTRLGHVMMRALAAALGLDDDWFDRTLTADPIILFRTFHYPALAGATATTAAGTAWSVGEHTDYGLLTMLGQDDTGGLQVHSTDGWIDVPPGRDAFVCNIGDMLERMTGGRYRSTPHRVRNVSDKSRISFAFFFDPGWDALVQRVPQLATGNDDTTSRPRWDGANVHELRGTYGEYLLAKVSKVFPDLGNDVL
jgi:isopenicillin N synthase-like dioxygenase